MSKLRRTAASAFADDTSLRLRAAWLYHGHGLTQNEVAEKLGVGRSTVIRLLEEAKARGEVRVWIEAGESALVELGLNIEKVLGLDEVIVVPASDNPALTAQLVGLALGKFLSETIADNMTIGAAWGRTLAASLASFHPAKHAGVKVMSLLGGTVETRFSNPAEYAWRIANALDAECYLFPAPLFVNSPETKNTLIDACGLGPVFQMAKHLDLAIVSAGDVSSNSTSMLRGLISTSDYQDLLALGCVGDVICNFIDAEGKLIDHPLNARVMSVGLERLKTAGHIVLASGGAQRVAAIYAAIKAVGCNTLVTDEAAARALLKLAATK